MSDLEMTKLCAEAMGLRPGETLNAHDARIMCVAAEDADGNVTLYNPLRDDAQALALVKLFRLGLCESGGHWAVSGGAGGTIDKDLNRAIVQCVAKMQAAHPTGDSRHE